MHHDHEIIWMNCLKMQLFQNNASKSSQRIAQNLRLPTAPAGMGLRAKRLVLLVLSLLFLCFLAMDLSTEAGHSSTCCSFTVTTGRHSTWTTLDIHIKKQYTSSKYAALEDQLSGKKKTTHNTHTHTKKKNIHTYTIYSHFSRCVVPPKSHFLFRTPKNCGAFAMFEP